MTQNEAPKTVMLAPNGGLPTGSYPKSELIQYTRAVLANICQGAATEQDVAG